MKLTQLTFALEKILLQDVYKRASADRYCHQAFSHMTLGLMRLCWAFVMCECVQSLNGRSKLASDAPLSQDGEAEMKVKQAMCARTSQRSTL